MKMDLINKPFPARAISWNADSIFRIFDIAKLKYVLIPSFGRPRFEQLNDFSDFMRLKTAFQSGNNLCIHRAPRVFSGGLKVGVQCSRNANLHLDVVVLMCHSDILLATEHKCHYFSIAPKLGVCYNVTAPVLGAVSKQGDCHETGKHQGATAFASGCSSMAGQVRSGKQPLNEQPNNNNLEGTDAGAKRKQGWPRHNAWKLMIPGPCFYFWSNRMNNFTPTIFNFQSIQFDVVDRNDQPWLKSQQIAEALGYQDERSITRIHARNADEFTEQMTCVVKLTHQGQMREVRIFSLRGAHLLAMFARTAIAKDFRKWVLDILDHELELLQIPQQFITAAQAGELATLIKERFPDGADRAYAWSRFNKHFRIARYRELPADHFMEACRYIPRMPDKDEIKQLTGQSVKALPNPDCLLPPDQAKEIMDRLNRLASMFHPFSDQFLDVLGVIRAMHGRNPKLGLEQPGYRKVMAQPQ